MEILAKEEKSAPIISIHQDLYRFLPMAQ